MISAKNQDARNMAFLGGRCWLSGDNLSVISKNSPEQDNIDCVPDELYRAALVQ